MRTYPRGVFTLPTRAAEADSTADPHGPAVRCVGLSKHFNGSSAVADASIELPRSSILALLGPSGVGKTTVLRMIAGFEAPDAGVIEVEGRVVVGSGVSTPPERRRVGMVFQDYALFPHMSVRDNIRFGLSSGTSRNDRVEEVLADLHVEDVSVQVLLAHGLVIQVVDIDGGHPDAPAVVSRRSD